MDSDDLHPVTGYPDKWDDDRFVCVLCGEVSTGFGNNPAPLAPVDSGQCCDHCNGTVVRQARQAE